MLVGECTECGKPAAPYKTCAACRKWRREWVRKRRDALRGKVCAICKGKLAKTSKSLCREHLDQQNRNQRAAYERSRKTKKCTRCALPPMRGSTRCRRHAAEQRAAQADYARRQLRRAKTHPNGNPAVT